MANREIVRDQITALLSAALVGTGKPCQEVVGYKKAVPDKVPLVCVMSAGSRRGADAVGSVGTTFLFAVVVFVSDANASAGWTEADVEDRLDWIDRVIEDTVQANRLTTYWADLDFTGEQSEVEDIALLGAAYATEVHMLAATILE